MLQPPYPLYEGTKPPTHDSFDEKEMHEFVNRHLLE